MTTGNQYLYDGEGRICAVLSPSLAGGSIMTGYIYDADGTRVAKGSISTWGSCDPAVNGFQTTSDYVLGPGGEQVTEVGMDANGNMAHQHTNVWAGGKLLATYDDNGLHFYLDDPLGTRRVQTDYAGVVEQSCTSLPYGDGESCTPTPTEHLFTGKERDTESGNDYFEARYYSSAMGRFLSPDWSAQEEPVPYAKLDDPQSLNLYSYVYNNPLGKADPDGHCPECVVWFDEAVSSPEGQAFGDWVVAGATAAVTTVAAFGDRLFNTPLPDGVSAIGGRAGNLSPSEAQNLINVATKSENSEKNVPNPNGSPGAPDHQAGVNEEVKKAQGEAGPGETVESNKKVQGHDSNRRPDVQIVDKNGKTRKIVEVERRPNSKRNKEREAEYNKHGIPNETKPIKQPGQN
jgi:RHS repeat-associated protein